MHYWRPDFTPEQMRYLMADYLEDLGHIEPERVEAACRQWRRNPENKFFPKIGELLELLKPEWEPRSHLPTFRAPPALPAPKGPIRSVADILRQYGFAKAARRWEMQ
jgi:hypothetical protein